MKVIICGGRTFRDELMFRRCLKKFQSEFGKITRVISGGAPGADSLAVAWARNNSIFCDVVNADWKKYGRAAGPIRNNEMINKEPDWVLAFPGGNGTKSMVNIARSRLIKVKEFRYE